MRSNSNTGQQPKACRVFYPARDLVTGDFIYADRIISPEEVADLKHRAEELRLAGGKYPEVIAEYDRLRTDRAVVIALWRAGGAIGIRYRNMNDLELLPMKWTDIVPYTEQKN